MGIERFERLVVHGVGEQSEGREELAAGVRQLFDRSLKDVVAALDEVKAGEVECGSAVGDGGPGVEVAARGQVVGDEPPRMPMTSGWLSQLAVR